jgi:hypothetical protein
MNTSTFAKLAAVAIGLSVFTAPAAARDHSRHGDYWWQSSGVGAYGDEYSYPGIRWYDNDCGYRHRHAHYRGEHHRRAKHSRRHHRGEWRYDREQNGWRND